jgi:hypothetical protein
VASHNFVCPKRRVKPFLGDVRRLMCVEERRNGTKSGLNRYVMTGA